VFSSSVSVWLSLVRLVSDPGESFSPFCKELHVRYALLIYETPEAFARRSEGDDSPYIASWRAYYQAVVDAGVYIGGDPLHPGDTATTVRQRDGKRLIQDGPYANTKEQLAGIMVFELPSLDAALDWAARCPASSYAAVEVRPIAPEAKHRITDGIG
jgi:hypothetical protein